MQDHIRMLRRGLRTALNMAGSVAIAACIVPNFPWAAFLLISAMGILWAWLAGANQKLASDAVATLKEIERLEREERTLTANSRDTGGEG